MNEKNGKALYREIGLLDEALIEEAEGKGPSGIRLRRWLPMAACLAILLAAGGIWQGDGLRSALPGVFQGNGPGTNPAVVRDDSHGLTLNHATVAVAASRIIEGHFWQSLTEAELAAVFKTEKEPGESYEITATANFSKTQDGVRLVDVVGQFAGSEGLTAQVTASQDEIIKCYLIDGEPVLSQIRGVSIDAGYFDDTNNGSVLYYADFKLDDVYYYVEMTGGKEDQEALFTLLDCLISGGKADFSVIEPTPPPVLRDDALTLQEALADEGFGAYIPESLSDGYSLNDANRFVNQQRDTLSLSFSRGRAEFMWCVSPLAEEEKHRITLAAHRQNYDLSLYPVPRADTVPKELWEIVENPIFKVEELTLEVVKARAYRISDTNDTDGWRMEFGVLYGDVLVEVVTKGAAPEEVFKLLAEIAPR